MEEAKQDIFDKDKLLAKSSTNKENLKRQVDSLRKSLEDAKYLLWDNIIKEVKN